jgi:hypothetical protein
MIRFAAAATAALLAASIAAAIPFVGDAIAAGFLLAAAAALGLALGYAIAANDPPFPDFDYRAALPIVIPPPPKALDGLPADLAPLRSLVEVLNRVAVALAVLRRTESKLVGAQIDNNAEGLRVQAEAYRQAGRLLRMAAAEFPGTAVEAISALRARKALPSAEAIREAVAAWRRDGLPNSVRDLWAKIGLPEDALAALEAIILSPVGPAEIPTVEVALQNVSDALGRVVRSVEAEASIAPTDFQRDAPAE